MVTGLALATVGLFYLTQLGTESSWLTHVLPAEILMSVGLALVFVPLSSLALFGVAPRDAGVASAMLNTTQQIGGSLGTALLNTLYASAVTGYLSSHTPGAAGKPRSSSRPTCTATASRSSSAGSCSRPR